MPYLTHIPCLHSCLKPSLFAFQEPYHECEWSKDESVNTKVVVCHVLCNFIMSCMVQLYKFEVKCNYGSKVNEFQN